MPKKFWKFTNLTGGSAELMLYGDISDTSWWGDEVTPKQFAEDLTGLGAVSEIAVRINSGGGDVFAAQAIGNLLEQHPANVTAKIDGLCASAATIIACHCNKVVAANDSTYMIHPVKMGLFGYMDAATLQTYIEALDTIKKNIVDLYAKKTCREKDEVAGWMDATSWWTGQEAKDNGFVDELVDNGEGAVVENRNGVLFVNSVGMGVEFGSAPAFVRDRVKNSKKEEKEVGPKNEIKTVDELRAAYPELIDKIEQEAADKATTEERQRIKDIEETAVKGAEELTEKAKFTEPVSASAYAVALLKHVKTQGAAFLESMQEDSKESGAEDVGNPPAPGAENEASKAKATAKTDVEAYLKNKRGRK